jgi:murein DD-endopeptidase MepM/ murein hydrolase activator NlpD
VSRRRLALLALPAFAAACQSPPQPEPSSPPEPVVEAPPPAPAFGAMPEPLPAAAFTYVGELTQGGWLRGFVPVNAVSVTLDGEPVDFAPDRGFFAAFDRDAGTSATLAAKLDDGSEISRTIAISPRDWEIEHINAARTPGGATEDFTRRREPELARINAARALRSDSQGWRQDFIWPAKGRISGRFGSQRIYRGEPGSYHSGLDIATGGSGTPFVAPADGVVILAAEQPFTLEGHLLMIDHGNGLNSAFLHCSELEVKEGDIVKQGQFIGRIGMTGRATGPHLHWSLKWNAARLDPLLFTGPMN